MLIVDQQHAGDATITLGRHPDWVWCSAATRRGGLCSVYPVPSPCANRPLVPHRLAAFSVSDFVRLRKPFSNIPDGRSEQ